MNHSNYDQHEITKFTNFAATWWDPNGDMKPLHQLNPLRLSYIQQHIALNNKRILDVGCGGGILSESLTKAGAEVTGIDLTPAIIDVAQQHAKQEQLSIQYQCISVEEFAPTQANQFDGITCLEMLEHVPDPTSIVKACATLLKPGGMLFFSTLNRNLKSYLFAIIGAEYLLRLLPIGTHEYGKFIRPSELKQWAATADLSLANLKGIRYNPLTQAFTLSSDTDVNYLMCFRKQ